jgi:type II secretory pathway pseudopilin PulG
MEVTARSKKMFLNQNGFTFLAAIFMVTIVGIMLGMTGQSWKTIMKREREKELLFRGSQIKEAIENWYKVKPGKHAPIALMDLNNLLEDKLTINRDNIYLPYTYATKLDDKNPKCAPDCPKTKLFQDPMTGKEWNIIKCDISVSLPEICGKFPGANTIIGVASKSDDTPLRTKESFKDTALENMGSTGASPTSLVIPPFGSSPATSTAGSGGAMTKYSEWKFIADPNNDKKKIYKAYHEGV